MPCVYAAGETTGAASAGRAIWRMVCAPAGFGAGVGARGTFGAPPPPPCPAAPALAVGPPAGCVVPQWPQKTTPGMRSCPHATQGVGEGPAPIVGSACIISTPACFSDECGAGRVADGGAKRWRPGLAPPH